VSNTLTTEDTRFRSLAIWGMVTGLLLMLAIFLGVSTGSSSKEQRSADIHACQMDAVRGGASLGMAELLCGKV
jgi:hypothetical protein